MTSRADKTNELKQNKQEVEERVVENNDNDIRFKDIINKLRERTNDDKKIELSKNISLDPGISGDPKGNKAKQQDVGVKR